MNDKAFVGLEMEWHSPKVSTNKKCFNMEWDKKGFTKMSVFHERWLISWNMSWLKSYIQLVPSDVVQKASKS